MTAYSSYYITLFIALLLTLTQLKNVSAFSLHYSSSPSLSSVVSRPSIASSLFHPLTLSTPLKAGNGNNHYEQLSTSSSFFPTSKMPLENKRRFLTLGRSRSAAKSVILPIVVGLATLLVHQQPAAASNFMESLAERLSSQATDSSGFVQAFLLIFISEIGDKTFFIAGLLAAKYGKLVSFAGSIGALAVMTIISTVLGQLFHAIPSSLTQGIPFDDIAAIVAFTYFGVKTLYEANQLEANDNVGIEEEKAEAEKTVSELTADQKRKSAISLLLTTFSLVFAAEIGDRSFLSTIALSAALNPFAVASGAIAAHASATGIAVAGGAFLSKYLSEKVIGYIGGSLFIVFAITTLIGLGF